MRNDVSVSQILPVVVGVDGTRTTPAIIDLAAGEAARRGIPLLIVHVWPGRYTGVFRGRGVVPPRADGLRLLEASAGRVQLAAPQLEIRTEMLDGGAAHVLSRCADDARLLVVGAPGRGGHQAELGFDDVLPGPSQRITVAGLPRRGAVAWADRRRGIGPSGRRHHPGLLRSYALNDVVGSRVGELPGRIYVDVAC